MKKKQSFSSFDGGPRRRRSVLPLVPVALVVLAALLIAFFWSRGGEQPQQRVEKVIPAEKLGQ